MTHLVGFINRAKSKEFRGGCWAVGPHIGSYSIIFLSYVGPHLFYTFYGFRKLHCVVSLHIRLNAVFYVPYAVQKSVKNRHVSGFPSAGSGCGCFQGAPRGK